jgi:predicted peptidase
MQSLQVSAVLSIAIAMYGCHPATPDSVPTNAGFVFREFHDLKGRESKYVVFVPVNYNPTVPTPAILFLHGAGQIGTDGKAQIRGGLAEAIRTRSESFPFLVIFPQSHDGSWMADTADGKRALAILDEVCEKYCVDRKRLYLTGYSMGGEGTWSIGAAHSERFAALVPICPGYNAEAARKLSKIPIWCFQGDADALNTVSGTRKMMLAIQSAGGRPIYHEYPGVEHNCWDRTYREDDVWEWLLEQRLSTP